MLQPVTHFDRAVNLQTLANTQDVEALADAFRVQAGLLKPSAAHPAADRIMDAGSVLATWAASYAPPGMVTENLSKAQASGFTNNHFKLEIATAFHEIIVHAFRRKTRHRQIARPIPARDFKEMQFFDADADSRLLPVAESGEVEAVAGLTLTEGPTARVSSYGRTIVISRRQMINGEIDPIRRLFTNMAGHAARLEAKLLHQTLDSNPTLADGEAMFHNDHGNVSYSNGVSQAGLQDAMKCLREQRLPVSDDMVDLEPAVLLVPAEHELAARLLVKETGLPITVHASIWLTSGSWYLLADPEEAAVLGLIHIGEGDAPNLTTTKARIEQPGVVMVADFHVGTVALGRIGAVRVMPA